MMWIFLLPGIYILIRFFITLQVGGIVGFSIFTFVWLVLWSRRLFYFGVSDHYLGIRMHNFFGVKKNYLLTDIREVVFESHYRMTTCLRIITDDFESKLYPADSLWSKRWMELKQTLEEKNIKVRNECVSYDPFEFKLYN
jgi:hypothetical protein